MLPPDQTNHPPKRFAGPPPSPEPPAGVERPKLDVSLRAENILLKEFDYAGLSAYQVYENRERIFNFYFTLMGALLSGLGALYQISINSHTDWRPLAMALLIAGGLLSSIFYVRLIHLRQNLRDSIITTYVIKEFYIQQFLEEIPNLEQAFRWRLATIPSGERPTSDTSFVLYPVATICAISFAVGALLADQLAPGGWALRAVDLDVALEPWVVALVVGAAVAFVEWLFHRSQLGADIELKILERQAMKLGITLGEAGQRQSASLLSQIMQWRQPE
ncbi:MAG TPA: hypothetical protein VF808_00860 [Ktedonobacterales bacterium]